MAKGLRNLIGHFYIWCSQSEGRNGEGRCDMYKHSHCPGGQVGVVRTQKAQPEPGTSKSRAGAVPGPDPRRNTSVSCKGCPVRALCPLEVCGSAHCPQDAGRCPVPCKATAAPEAALPRNTGDQPASNKGKGTGSGSEAQPREKESASIPTPTGPDGGSHPEARQ